MNITTEISVFVTNLMRPVFSAGLGYLILFSSKVGDGWFVANDRAITL